MINLESKTTFESKVFPGVTFTIKKYTEGVRQKLRIQIGNAGRQLAEALAEKARLDAEHQRNIENTPGLAEAKAKLEKLLEPLKPDDLVTPEIIEAQRLVQQLTPLPSSELLDASQLVDDIHSCDIRPAYLRVGFVSAQNIQADGHALSADDILNLTDPRFYHEIVSAIEGEFGLSEKQKGESALPSTSGAREDGSDQSTSAENASGKDTTNSETAADTSPIK